MTSYSTSDIRETVKSRVCEGSIASIPPRTVCQAFEATAKKFPDFTCLMSCTGEKSFTYKEYYDISVKTAKSLIHLGLNRYESVNIIGFNAPEYMFAFTGCVFAGGVACGVYATNSPEVCKEVFQVSNGAIIVAHGPAQFQKYLDIKDTIKPKAIVLFSGDNIVIPGGLPFPVYQWNDFLELGKDVPEATVRERMDSQDPFSCCNLVMTSGTTGNQKAVMISHDNMIWASYTCLYSCCSLHNEQELAAFWPFRMVSYLPLSHVAAQLVDMFVAYVHPVQIWFAKPDALKGSLVETLHKCRPNIFMGVPRVWEKMHDKIKKTVDSATGLKKCIVSWAFSKGEQHRDSLQYGSSVKSVGCYGMADSLLVNKVKSALGLNQVKICITSAAPINADILKFLATFDLSLYELLGMSEATGPVSTNSHEFWKACPACKGVDVKLSDGCHEILFRGRNVFMGYKDSEAETRASIDEDGYMHSGDIGEFDKDGFLTVVGRLKDVIITAGGENVSPLFIEDKMKMLIPALCQVIVIGDKRKFLSVLLTLKNVPNQESNPTNEMNQDSLELAKSIGSSAKTLSDAAVCEKFQEHIQKQIDTFNKSFAISNAQQIRKWKLLDRDFGINTGELTPTMKMKRAFIMNQFQAEIDALYTE